MASLIQLPTEIHHCILSHLSTNDDFKRVALTCKDLQNVALSHIYHSISIDISRLSLLAKQLRPQNPGLGHVRRIRINDEWREFNQLRHGASLAQLVRAIPRDSLEVFELVTTQPVSSDFTSLLEERQRFLKNYHLHPRAYGGSIETVASSKGLSNVRSVSVNVRNLDDCRRGAQLIRSSRFLTALSIDLDYVDEGRDTSTSGLDSSSISLKILETLLAPIDGETSVLARPLRRLQLKRLNLASAGEVLPNLLDFSSLEELSLVSCVQPSRLLAALNETALQLKSFTNERACDDDLDTQGTLDTFLQSFTGLQTLRISSDIYSSVYADCSWKTIERHASTLRSLFVDDTKREQFPFTEFSFDRSIQAFDELCSRCSQLTDVAIRCPSTESKDWEHAGGFDAFLECLTKLPSLTVLRLLAYPEEKKTESAEANARQQRTEMQQIADKVFATLQPRCPRLTVLAVDARKPHQDCRSTRYVTRYAFTRRLSHRTSARAASLRMLKHYEPGCDAILHDAVWQH